MKTLRWVLLWLLFCVLLAPAIPVFVDRSEFTHASAAYAKDPSPANTKELARQQRINQSIRVRMEFLEFCALL